MKHILLAILLMLAGAAQAQTSDPTAVANAFYAVYAAQHAQTGGGIPDATGRLRYSAMLSPRLNKQLADAAAAQRRLTAKMKNVVPPMLEGDIFSSLFEGATAWKVGACPNDGKTARCTVALTYATPPAAGKQAAKPTNWNDTLVLTNTPQGWKVDDVLYDAGFAFGNTGRLTSMLQMVIAANP
jgi:hypothetical protein